MILVFAELGNGKIKKTSFEAVAYASALGETTAIAIGEADSAELEKLGGFGVTKVLHVGSNKLNQFYSKAYAKAIQKAADVSGADTIVMAHNSTGKSVAPRIAIRMKASLLPGVSELPSANKVKKTVFSGKAFAEFQMSDGKKVITVNPNSVKAISNGNKSPVEALDLTFDETDFDYQITGTVDESGGHVPLADAEIVVSGGRGLKGPENWGMIEELANALGAATACSRPVADVGWRPHHEHVGQTGITIKPTLYIAVGISGAIQHLAGVNQSKVIVVINKDAEAPFFKAADYGIVGDAFEVLPKITEAVKKLKAS